MRDVKRKAEKKKSHLIGKQLQRITTQDGNIKLIHFHLTILSSILFFWVFLIAFLRFSSLLTKYFNVIQVERLVKKARKKIRKHHWNIKKNFFFLLFIAFVLNA